MNKPEGTGIEFQKYVTIDGQIYKIHAFAPSKAFKLGARVAKFLGEPVAAMSVAGGDESKVADVLPLAVKALMNNLHEDEIWALMNELTACVTCEGKSIQVDSHFMGKMGALLKLQAAVIEFQFKDFFDAIGQAVAGAIEKVKE